MKNWVLIIFFAGIWITSCHTGNASGPGKDTVKNNYGTNVNDTTNASKSNIDTSKVTVTTGDASDIDNSASGGTKTSKDTGKQKVAPKK
jgi:hypothetical protein